MNIFSDPDYWRDRAEKTRAKAGSYWDRNSRIDLLKVAEEYDRLAKRAEDWQRSQDNPEMQSMAS